VQELWENLFLSDVLSLQKGSVPISQAIYKPRSTLLGCRRFFKKASMTRFLNDGKVIRPPISAAKDIWWSHLEDEG
jgi:hypothetical protein